VLLTGAGGGLGSAVAERFTSQGATVVCVDLAVADGASSVPSGQGGVGRTVWFAADVSDEADVARLRQRVHEAVGPVDMVFNVAGILRRSGLAETDAVAFRHVVDVNLTGTYIVTRAFADDLIAHGSGRVVNVGSVAGVTGYPALAYAASKAGVASLTRSLLHDFWGTGVTVNAVCPGAMATPMMDASIVDAVTRKTPASRVVPPQEVAAVFDFFAGDEAASVNGQVLVVDGGATTVFQYPDR
jgi:NAD(P)-dependent dehydrogenase (short-subunit alcohol dehydrogenase family)